jgi:hypothetical protein
VLLGVLRRVVEGEIFMALGEHHIGFLEYCRPLEWRSWLYDRG